MNATEDDSLARALREEEALLLERLGEEPGFFQNALRSFSGRTGWVAILSYALNILSFLAFVFAAMKAADATEALLAVKWSLAALSFLILAVYFKTTLALRNETNRVLRELRLLQAALLSEGGEKRR
jgi:hypothetical protein